MKKRRILSLTGTRADYGIYKPVYRAIEQSSQLLLELVVVGMHLRKEFGRTVDGIRDDGFPIVAELDTVTTEDTPRSMAEYVGRTTVACASVLDEHRPDIVFLLGDRGEMLAGAIAAAELGIPIAHLHGGEQTGSIDDVMRNAITHMASLHLTTADPHSEAVQRMKGSADNVYTVGAPALDVIRTFTPIPKEILCKDHGLNPKLPVLLFVQHPDTREKISPEEQLQPSLEAMRSFPGNIMILGANADAGGIRMNALLQQFVKGKANYVFVLSLPHEQFLSWEASADVLVGNSSSGIIEAASFHLPVVNIGGRQYRRTRSGNVLDVPYDAEAITRALQQALRSETFRAKVATCRNAYGDGHAAERIVRILEHFVA